MRENTNLVIYGEKVTLVPYREEHVEKYHEWMVSLNASSLFTNVQATQPNHSIDRRSKTPGSKKPLPLSLLL